ncbi:hypothetical protein NC651_025584 [Populus alba x Populus x berolinensis]|nr:hypothetical protein NC651_025584 [Populus alba x Populus x berolinensis]
MIKIKVTEPLLVVERERIESEEEVEHTAKPRKQGSLQHSLETEVQLSDCVGLVARQVLVVFILLTRKMLRESHRQSHGHGYDNLVLGVEWSAPR